MALLRQGGSPLKTIKGYMRRLLFISAIAIVLASCSAQKRALYLQDLSTEKVMELVDNYQIRLKPHDQITVVVNSRFPELAAPFNTSSSYNSLTGTPIDRINTVPTTTSAMQIRTIDENGKLFMPIIGEIDCNGKTRHELAREIERLIREGGHIQDPSVNVQFADLAISILGEVTRPGRFNITSDRITLLDALALAGDLTIYGQRSDVTVIREVGGVRTTAQLDLTSQDIFLSPYYYLQQNDIVYVKPNKYKAQTGEYNQNRTFYLSLISTAISVATLIVTINFASK